MYSCKTTSQFGWLVYFIGNPTGGMPENPVYKQVTSRILEEKKLDKLIKKSRILIRFLSSIMREREGGGGNCYLQGIGGFFCNSPRIGIEETNGIERRKVENEYKCSQG